MAFMKSPIFGENSVKISEMKYIIVIKMKICHCDQKIYHHDLKFITLVIWGLYTNVINFTFLPQFNEV